MDSISTNFWRATSAAIIVAAAGIASTAQAQTTNSSGAAGASSNQAGEAYPSNANAASKSKPTADVVQRVDNSRPVQATKRGVKRAGNAVKRAGNRTASAVRNTGEKIGDKIPPGPNDNKK